MPFKIFKFNELDLAQLRYSKPVDGSFVSPKEYKKGFQIVYVSYQQDKTNYPLLIEIPSLLLKEDYNEQKRDLLLPLSTKDKKHDKSLNSFFANLDKTIIKDVSKILKSLKIKLNNISYNAVLKSVEGDSGYQNGAIQIRILPSTKLYDPNKEAIDHYLYPSVLTRGCYVGAIIELSSVLISHEQIIVDIKPHQLRVSFAPPKQIVLTEYSFADSDNETVTATKTNETNKIIKSLISAHEPDSESESGSELQDDYDSSDSSEEVNYDD